MEWKYLSIPKLHRCNRWSLGMDKLFHPTLYWACNYLSMLGLKLNHVSKRHPRTHPSGSPNATILGLFSSLTVNRALQVGHCETELTCLLVSGRLSRWPCRAVKWVGHVLTVLSVGFHSGKAHSIDVAYSDQDLHFISVDPWVQVSQCPQWAAFLHDFAIYRLASEWRRGEMVHCTTTQR